MFSTGNRWHHLMPDFERNLPFIKTNPHAKLEVDRSKQSRVIERKPFSDGATWCQQMAPPGARFRKEPSFHQNESTCQVRSWSVKAILSYWVETVFRWHHLAPTDGATWCPISKGTFLSSRPIHMPSLKSIRQSILELLSGNAESARPTGKYRTLYVPPYRGK